jgi:hypothetical protein
MGHRFLSCILGCSLSLLGCSGNGESAPKNPDPNKAADAQSADATSETGDTRAPVHQDTFFVGTSEYVLPSGTTMAGPDTLVRRTVDEANSTILEDVSNVRPGSLDPPERYVVTFAVTGSAFTMTANRVSPDPASEVFTGSGSLVGEPWAWTAWTSHTVLEDGSTVDSSDTLGDSVLVVEKHYYNENGILVVTIHETLPIVSQDVYEAAMDEAFGGG